MPVINNCMNCAFKKVDEIDSPCCYCEFYSEWEPENSEEEVKETNGRD